MSEELPKPATCSFCGSGDYPYRIQSSTLPNVSICFPCIHEAVGMLLVNSAKLKKEEAAQEEKPKTMPAKKSPASKPKKTKSKSP